MNIAGAVVPQLVINVLLVLGAAAYLLRTLRRHTKRAFVITVFVLALVGLCVNLTGHTIEGWQEGFHVDHT